MEYNQFRQLLQLKGIREKETIPLLEDFIEKFPYCQTSRILLAKALHDQDNIHYDQHLKLAAAHVPDREMLRSIMEAKTEEVEFEFPLKKSEPLTQNSSAVHDHPAVPEEEKYEEWYSEDEISGRAFEEQKKNETHADPHEVIRQRLSEILGDAAPEIKNEADEKVVPDATPVIENTIKPADPVPPQEPVAEIEYKTQETEKSSAPVAEKSAADNLSKTEDQPAVVEPHAQTSEKSQDEKVIIEQAARVQDVLDTLELEHAMEESILDSLEKLPVIAPPRITGFENKSGAIPKEEKPVERPPVPQEKAEDLSGEKSFTEWLKTIGTSSKGYEEVHAPILKTTIPVTQLHEPSEESDAESQLSDDELIEKFLLEDPKIIPSKSEFYSPVTQAKKSVMDHDDVVSETLAQIYLSQGNSQKARWCYEKLILLHPEKSAFFAALLKEIDEQTNNKEDL